MESDLQLLTNSNLFDADWYATAYPDVRSTGLSAAEHYLKYGVAFGRNPSLRFNTRFYLSRYPDVAASGMNPLLHYLQFGHAENRQIQPESDEDPDLLAQKTAQSRVRELRLRLLNLGFHERALRELNALTTSANPYERQLAAWELAAWYANRYTAEDAERCLGHLAVLSQQAPDPSSQRRIAILQAEAYDLLGQADKGQAVLEQAFSDPHADVYLAYSRYQSGADARVASINRALEHHKLSPVSLLAGDAAIYDRLAAVSPHATDAETTDAETTDAETTDADAKVTVIIPCYNAQETLATTLRSLLAQSWQNLEIIVADDCSSDETVAVAAEFLRQDPRISLIRNPENSGPYVARNRALKIATGDFVTCNDADDWSHPQKIEIQLRHLIAHPDIVANTSQQARCSDELVFHRRGNAGFYLQFNISSLMFRRELISKIGYWDSVRFAADSEFMRRIQTVYGKKTIVHLESGPLSFQRQTDDSLTGSSTFGYHGYKMGARKTYEDNHRDYHKKSKKPFIDFPLSKRPFPIPEPMQPRRQSSQEHFDIIIASDFRMPGGTSMSNAEEIKANDSLGFSTGLLQLNSYHMNPTRGFNPEITRLIQQGKTRHIVYGETVSCDLLLVRLPWVLQDWQAHVPQVKARHIRVIVNQPPKRDYGAESESLYDLRSCAENLQRYFGQPAIWSPIGPLVRQALLDHHAGELQHIQLSSENWHNIINLSEWQRQERPKMYTRIKLCRHSRDQYVKWPATREQLEKIYPVGGTRYSVNILGGAETPKKLLGGKLPANWKVADFGKEQPAKFLAKHDIFVYYTHPDWVESFGRVIFEAMAVGLPVILPPVYRRLFQDAAIYAEPDEVLAAVDALMADDRAYERQVATAREYVNQHFGYSYHEQRIRDIIDTADGLPLLNLSSNLPSGEQLSFSFSDTEVDQSSQLVSIPDTRLP